MNSRITLNAYEGIFALYRHALARILGQQPSGNQVKATSEEKRHQGEQLPEYAVPKVVALSICLEVVPVGANRVTKREVVKPQTVAGLLGAHRSTDDLPVRIVQEAG